MKDSEKKASLWQGVSSSPMTFGVLGFAAVSLAVVAAARITRRRRNSYSAVHTRADLERQMAEDTERLMS